MGLDACATRPSPRSSSRVASGVTPGITLHLRPRRRAPGLARARLSALVISIGVLLLVSCRTSQVATRPEPGSNQGTANAAIDVAAVAAALDAHAFRVGQLGRTYSRGVIEFRWVDDEGREHFEPQVNARLWIELPRRTALRGEKLGRDLLWLGSDNERFWFFDLTRDETVLYVGRHGESGLRGTGSPLPIEPLALLDLMGLTEITWSVPAGSAGDRGGSGGGVAQAGGVVEDVANGLWIITGTGAGGAARLHLDRRTLLPVRVESLSAEGDVLLSSQLRRYRSVSMPGAAKMARPQMPTLIDITDPDGSLAIKLALDEPTGEGGDDRWRSVFELDGLTGYLRPGVTHRLGAGEESR